MPLPNLLPNWRRKIIVYLSGPYRSADGPTGVMHNIVNARKAAIKLWEAGFTVICPHLNTANFENDCKIKDDDYLEGDIYIIRKCDAVCMLDGWQSSEGAKIERMIALSLDIPVIDNIDLLLQKTGITELLAHKSSC